MLTPLPKPHENSWHEWRKAKSKELTFHPANSPWELTLGQHTRHVIGSPWYFCEAGVARPFDMRESRVMELEARSAWNSLPSNPERNYYPHSSDEESECQRKQVTDPRSHVSGLAERRSTRESAPVNKLVCDLSLLLHAIPMIHKASKVTHLL